MLRARLGSGSLILCQYFRIVEFNPLLGLERAGIYFIALIHIHGPAFGVLDIPQSLKRQRSIKDHGIIIIIYRADHIRLALVHMAQIEPLAHFSPSALLKKGQAHALLVLEKPSGKDKIGLLLELHLPASFIHASQRIQADRTGALHPAAGINGIIAK